MRRSFSPWFLLLLVVALCAAVLSGVALLRARRNTPARLIERLPDKSSAIIFVDFAALRRAGIMSLFDGSEVTQEAEYRAFVEGTGFDYTRDLDSAFIAFAPEGRYLLVRGRFDWRLLKDYVEAQGGRCRNAFCRVEGSTPERQISYFPVERDLMALAVSPDSWAASQMQIRRPRQMELPNNPVWAVFTGSALADSDRLPAGSRAFIRALDGAERMVLAADQSKSGEIELSMRVSCRTGEQASALTARLKETTAMLQDLLRKEGQAPNPRDLSGVLTNGAFEQNGNNVIGRWPVPKAFLESLAGGGV